MVRQVEWKDQSEWVRMRKTLWPDCDYEEQVSETTAIFKNEPLALDEALGWIVLVYSREGGGLGGFIEVSIKSKINESFQTDRRLVC